jgi:hypothetical protein
MATPEELLEAVTDRDTFISFVSALAAEREQAEDIERADPQRYGLDGALGWKNGDIAAFLDAALTYFEETAFHRPERKPSWRMFAEFLYQGKIIE